MSSFRRAAPEPARRGWCPGLARPMPTGDGLLARVHPPLGRLSPAQARAVAEGARRFGNGHVDVTARANLQVRGVSAATRAPLARLLEDAGLGDARADGGPQRITLTSPLAGVDPAEVVDVPALARAVEEVGLAVPGLPAKTLVAIEGRPGVPVLDADFLVSALAPGHVRVAIACDGGHRDLAACGEADAPALLAALLAAFARSARRRARDLSDDVRDALAGVAATTAAEPPPPSAGEGVPGVSGGRERGAPVQARARRSLNPGPSLPSPPPLRGAPSPAEGGGRPCGAAALPPAGLTPFFPALAVLAVEAPFGRCTADALDRLAAVAETVGADDIRLSPARGFVLLAVDSQSAASVLADLAADFITAPGDPRRAVAACTGAPACASGSTPTLPDAARLADAFRPLAARGLRVHLSGCAKGCAGPGPADLTLVGRDGVYGAVVGGTPGDAPGLHLPIGAVLERLGRAATVGIAAAFAPDRPAAGNGTAGHGRDRRPG